MATTEQLKALIQSYADRDDARFYRIALQVAAHEARSGHAKLAGEIRALVDEARTKGRLGEIRKEPIPIARPRGELKGLLSVTFPDLLLRDMVLPPDLRDALTRLLKEHRQQHKLQKHALTPKRKVLLLGPPGTGKSMTAKALAAELHLPLLTVRFDALITKFMGETAAQLRLIFDEMAHTRGVYLFDEFDAIGAQRAAPNDIGEIRRVLNSFLQFLEDDSSESLIVAATNHSDILDFALFRRFDDVLRYSLPSDDLVLVLLTNRMAAFGLADFDAQRVVRAAHGLSHAEIVRACEEAVKQMILDDHASLSSEDLERVLESRKANNVPAK